MLKITIESSKCVQTDETSRHYGILQSLIWKFEHSCKTIRTTLQRYSENIAEMFEQIWQRYWEHIAKLFETYCKHILTEPDDL